MYNSMKIWVFGYLRMRIRIYLINFLQFYALEWDRLEDMGESGVDMQPGTTGRSQTRVAAIRTEPWCYPLKPVSHWGAPEWALYVTTGGGSSSREPAIFQRRVSTEGLSQLNRSRKEGF